MHKTLFRIGKWLRVKIRMIIWKQWKNPKTRELALLKLGYSKKDAYSQSNTRKSYYRVARSWILAKAITNERLKKRGLLDPVEYYHKSVVA